MARTPSRVLIAIIMGGDGGQSYGSRLVPFLNQCPSRCIVPNDHLCKLVRSGLPPAIALTSLHTGPTGHGVRCVDMHGVLWWYYL